MPQALPARTRTLRSYAAVALFLAVYLGVLIVVFAPKEMIGVQSGAIFAEGE
jgi:hypothetical protein